MTPTQLAEIRKRCKEAAPKTGKRMGRQIRGELALMSNAIKDIPALLDEVARLQGIIEDHESLRGIAAIGGISNV